MRMLSHTKTISTPYPTYHQFFSNYAGFSTENASLRVEGINCIPFLSFTQFAFDSIFWQYEHDRVCSLGEELLQREDDVQMQSLEETSVKEIDGITYERYVEEDRELEAALDGGDSL